MVNVANFMAILIFIESHVMKDNMHCWMNLLVNVVVWNAAFLVQTSCVNTEDLPFEDNGSYKSKGSHTWTFALKEEEEGKFVKELIGKRYIPGNDTSTVHLRRKYHTNKSCEEFWQIVSYVEDSQGNILGGVALVQYNFTGVETKFKVEAHGNKKDKTENKSL